MLTVAELVPTFLFASVSALAGYAFYCNKKARTLLPNKGVRHARATGRPAEEIPGLEPAHPQMGNIGDIAAAGGYYAFLLQLHQRFGPMAKFYFGPEMNVSICTPELFRETSRAFDRPAAMFEIFSPLMDKKSLAFVNGQEGKQRRTHYDRAYSHAAMEGYYAGMLQVSKELVEEWAGLQGKRIAVKDPLLTAAMRSVLQECFGDFFSDLCIVKRMKDNFDWCWHELERRATGDMAEPGSERDTELMRRRDDIYDTARQMIAHRRAHPPEAGDELFVDIVLAYGREDDDLVEADCVDFILGGYMSTGDLLTWLMYLLGKNPDVQDRLVEELREVLGDQDVGFHSTSQLRYMKQMLDESLRVSLLGTMVLREVDRDFAVGGFVLPAHTPIVQAMGVLHMDPTYYPEPEKFDPDRFHPDEVKKRPRHAFVPFGFAGGRLCPGFRFTYVECTVLLSVLLRRFRIRFSDADGKEEATRVHGLLSFLKEEVYITLEER